MATGILSFGLRLTGYVVLSQVTLVLASVAWLALTTDFVVRLLLDRERWLAEAGTPAALTAVSATTVLGTRFSAAGWQALAAAALALAALLWPVLLVDVVRHWRGRRRMSGTVFLSSVATQGLAVLGATLARADTLAWLAHAALLMFWLGLAVYVFTFGQFDTRQVMTGAGDQWVAGGALAIAALAGARLLAADDHQYLWNGDDRGALRTVAVIQLILAAVWYVVLLAGEVLRPRLHYDVRRWSTVFPMGMTAVAALSVGSAADVPWLRGAGQVLLWIAVAVWLAVAVGAVGQALAAIRSTAPR